jgi:molybdopterin-synthase adenylyltransferase
MKSSVLVCGFDFFDELRKNLLSASPNEAAAILLCTSHTNLNQQLRILVKEIVYVPQDSYIEQGFANLTISPLFLSRVFKRARENGYSVVMVHTHPYDSWPEFSHVDDAGEASIIPVLQNRIPEKIHGALVLGKEGFTGRIYEPGHLRSQRIDSIVLNGAYIQRLTDKHHVFEPNPIYDRNVRAFGDGQKVLQSMTVGIVGLGGMGSLVAQKLAHLGIGKLKLIDFDQLDITNLNRVVGATRADVGKPKVEVAKNYLATIAPDAKIEAILGSILKEDIARQLLDCDFVFSCTDSHGSRAVLNQLAYQYFIPIIDTGVRIDALEGKIQAMAGRVQMLAAGLPCLVCGNLLDAEQVRRDFLTDDQRKSDPYIVGHAEPQPAVISINATIASLAVTMFLSATVRVPSVGRHLIYLVAESTIRRIGGNPNPNCVICSSDTAFASADDWRMSWQL